MCLAVPGQLISISGDGALERTGRVDFGGVVKEVSLACTPEARAGDFLLVHVGLAISIVDEAEAREVWSYLERMHELEDLGPAAAPQPRCDR